MPAHSPRRAAQALPVYPTLADVHRIMAACEHDRDRMLISLLWHTGARISEALALRVGDITQSGVRLLNEKQKSGPTEKHVFCPPEFLAELRAYCAGKQPQDLVIGQLADPMHGITRVRAWQIITQAGRRAGVFKQRFRQDTLRPPWCHSFRHGYAVHLLESGVPISAVQGQLGHADLSSTQVYTALSDQHRQRLVAGVNF